MESSPYRITDRPKPGYMLVVKHYGRWYLQDSEDRFYGPYEGALSAIADREPKNGQRLEELPTANSESGSVH